MGLVHVPCGKDARLSPERADQNRVTLEIDHADLTVSRQPQILSGNVHDNGKPFSAAQVTEHPKAGILGKELLTGGAESFGNVVFELSSIHRFTSFSLAQEVPHTSHQKAWSKNLCYQHYRPTTFLLRPHTAIHMMRSALRKRQI